MPEGQWEVVGKGSKKEKPMANGKPKGKDEKRKLLENSPKLEDILPPSQIKSLFAAMEAEEKKNAVKKEKKEEPKKQQPKKTQPEKKADPPKPKPPKSIEAAFQAIDTNHFADVINSNKARFSNAPLIWLKEIVTYLNSKTPIDVPDILFSNQSVNYPSNVLPSEVRKTIEGLLREAGGQIQQLLYDGCLTALAHDMSRGQSSIGNRVIIQMLAQENPDVSIAAIGRSKSVWNSYQNRPPIGQALLWSFGQGGFKNLDVGLQVWQELFAPVVEQRNYSKYSIAYLTRLLDRHSKMESRVTQEQFLALVDAVEAARRNGQRDPDLVKQIDKIRKIYLKSAPSRLQVTFNQLMRRMPLDYLISDKLDVFNVAIAATLVACLQHDESCHATWRQLHNRCVKQSATLLGYIDSRLSQVDSQLKLKSLESTLDHIRKLNAERKKDDLASKIDHLCQTMAKKIKKQQATSRGFPWIKASLALLLAIIGVLIYDVTSAGSFPKSTTGKLLQDAGLLESTQAAWKKTLQTSARGFVWVETNAPVYYSKAVEVSKPYGELAYDLYLIGSEQVGKLYNNTRDYATATAPKVRATIEQYAPGMLETVGGYVVAGKDAVYGFTSVYYASGRDYLQSRVFVGEWAPEVLQDKTLKALNSTRTVVGQYASWFHEQVHLYSK